jgi:hypothetical protein
VKIATFAKPENVTGNAMKHTTIILTILILTFINVKAQSDCDYVYTRQAIDHVIKWNQFNIDLSSQLIDIKEVGAKTILSIDTSAKDNWIIYNNYSQSKGGPYQLTFRDSIYKKQKIRQYSIKDIVNHSSFPLMHSSFAPDYFYYPDFYILNKLICFYNINKYKKYEIVFFDVENKKVYTITTNSISGHIGKSDTSVFVRIQDKFVQIGNQKYKEGEFVSISKNGSYKVDVIDNIMTDTTLEFFNSTFSAQEVLTKRETNDCIKTDHYKTFISAKGKRVDSVAFKVVHFTTNDIPKIDFTLDRLTFHNSDFFKVYYPNGDINSWDNKYWTNKLEILQKCTDKKYLLIENKLFVIVHTDLTKQTAVLGETDYTLNNLIVDKSSTDFQTILIFDIRKNEFIGYPTIAFEKH